MSFVYLFVLEEILRYFYFTVKSTIAKFQIDINCFFFFVVAGRRRVRHGIELRDPGRAEHTAHARATGPLPAELAGNFAIYLPPTCYMTVCAEFTNRY